MQNELVSPVEPGLVNRVAETLNEQLGNLHQLVGPELRKFIESHDLPFSTMNAIEKYGTRLLRVVNVLKETASKLKEVLTEPVTDQKAN